MATRVLAFCLLLVPLPALASGAENLLRNGGFESGANGWSLDGAALAIDGGGNARQGKRALRFRLEGKSEASQTASQTVAVSAAGRYVLSFFALTKDVYPVERLLMDVHVLCHGRDLGTLPLGGSPQVFIGQHYEWDKVVTVLQGIPSQATHLRIAFRSLAGTVGRLWIDDVRLEETTPYWLDITTETPVNIFAAGVPARGVITLHGPPHSTRGTLAYRMEDFWGNAVSTRQKEVAVASGSIAAVPFEFSGLGYFEVVARFQPEAGPSVSARDSLAILPPGPSRGDQETAPSLFGAWMGGIEQMPILGVHWTRFIVGWDLHEPQRGRYDLEATRREIRRARNLGLEVILSLHQIARWASRAPASEVNFHVYPPRNWQDWAAFVRRMVREFRKDVRVWEVCNEPIAPWGWKGSVADLVQLHRVACEAIKAEQPEATVLGPCYGPIGTEPEIRALCDAGLLRWVDGLSHHPYTRPLDAPPPPEGCGYRLDLLSVDAIARAHGAKKDLWLTEFGWMAGPKVRGFTEHDRAGVLARAYLINAALGVRVAIWHSMSEGKLWDPTGETGLLRAAVPNEPQAPKAAFVAYATLTRLLTGAKFRQELDSLGGSRTAYIFDRRGEPVLAVWDWAGTGECEISVGARAVTVVDLMGNRRSVECPGETVKLRPSPFPVFVLGGSAGRLLRRELQALRFESDATTAKAGSQLAFDAWLTNPSSQPLMAEFVAVVPADFGQTFSLPVILSPGQTVRKNVRLPVPTGATSGTRLVNTCLRPASTGPAIAERTLVVELTGGRTP
jgi:hypothetical protein